MTECAGMPVRKRAKPGIFGILKRGSVLFSTKVYRIYDSLT
jgi:hypothetical protein